MDNTAMWVRAEEVAHGLVTSALMSLSDDDPEPMRAMTRDWPADVDNTAWAAAVIVSLLRCVVALARVSGKEPDALWRDALALLANGGGSREG